MNEEYLRAKFNLCLDQAEKNIKEEEIALAIKNLERANSAMARLFGGNGRTRIIAPAAGAQS